MGNVGKPYGPTLHCIFESVGASKQRLRTRQTTKPAKWERSSPYGKLVVICTGLHSPWNQFATSPPGASTDQESNRRVGYSVPSSPKEKDQRCLEWLQLRSRQADRTNLGYGVEHQDRSLIPQGPSPPTCMKGKGLEFHRLQNPVSPEQRPIRRSGGKTQGHFLWVGMGRLLRHSRFFCTVGEPAASPAHETQVVDQSSLNLESDSQLSVMQARARRA